MKDRPQNKHLKPNPHTLGITPLPSGYKGKEFRVSAPIEVIDWLTTLTALERGELLSKAYEAHK